MLRLAGALGVSVGLHVVFMAAVLLGAIPLEWTAAAVQPEPVAFEILTVPTEHRVEVTEPSLEPEPRATPEPAAPEPAEPAATRVPDPRPRAVEPRVVDPRALSDEPGPSSTSTLEPPSVRDDRPPGPMDPQERERINVLIDPSNVARGGFDFGPGPSQRGGPAGIGPVDRPGTSVREIERRLASGLRAEAMTKRHTERAPFVLRRRSDGAQVWDGPRLSCAVMPDGSVDFDDRPNVQTNGFSASGTFDATEAIMGAAGQDPLRAEREYCMRNTEELRERLEAEHRAREMERGLTTLRGRLARVWATSSRSAAARRLRIFTMWDDAAEDAGGSRARDIVIQFIRDTLPPGSEDAFTEDELRRWNSSRASREPFSPY